ncbi:MAG TPA: extracellular solute-binding protein, partial [Bacilli bacterium]
MSRKKYMMILFSILLLTLVMLTTVMDGTDVKAPASLPLEDNGEVDPTKIDIDPDEEGKVLKVALSMEPGEFSLLQSLTYEFESTHPEIDVELENLPKSGIYRIYKRNAQLGNATDIMLLDNIWINEFAALGYLSHRIDEFFSSELQSQQIEDVMSQVKWNGYIWGVPKDVDPYVMVWNKTRLSEVQLENPPASAKEFISINSLLRDKATNRYGLYLDPTDPYALLSLIWTAGGGFQNTTNNPVTLNDNNKTLLLLESLFSDKAEGNEETPEAPSFIIEYPDYI